MSKHKSVPEIELSHKIPTATPPPIKPLTIPEVTEIFRIALRTFHPWIFHHQFHDLKSIKLRRDPLFLETDLPELIKSRKENTARALVKTPQSPDGDQ
jgi:hypothetical protein